MDVPTTMALVMSSIATICAVASLIIALSTRRTMLAIKSAPDKQKNERYAEIAGMLSDGSMVWQRLVVQCDDSSTMISGSVIQVSIRDNISDWLVQLRAFCKQSKSEIDRAYQLFATESKNMSPDDMEQQRPDMEKFHKEMRSNVAVISDQLDHVQRVLQGHQAPGNQQFKITLHKPQVMPLFLRKRLKIAELQRRKTNSQQA